MHIPDPLHPAVVHFPVVFVLAGAVLVCAALFRGRLAPLAAVCLALAAVSSVVAVETGHKERRDEIAVPEGEGRRVLDKHEKDGEAVRNLASAAAALAVAAACLRARWPAPGRAVALAAACLAVLCALRMVEAGRTGGELVYHHGVGLRF